MLSDQHHKRKTEGCGITHRFKEREFTDCGEMQAGELRECGGVEGLGRVVIRWRMDEDVEEEASLSQAVPSSDHWLKTTAGPDYSGCMRAHVHMHITLLSSLPQTHTSPVLSHQHQTTPFHSPTRIHILRLSRSTLSLEISRIVNPVWSSPSLYLGLLKTPAWT